MMFQMTKHAKEDRFERFEQLIDCGIQTGEIFCKCQHKDYDNREEILTTTGILVVVVKNTNLLITGYVCSVDKANSVYKTSMHYDNAKLPKSMVEKIKRNNKLISNKRG